MNAIPSLTLAVSAEEKVLAAASSGTLPCHTQAGLVAREWTGHLATTIGVQRDMHFEAIADVGGFGRDPAQDLVDARRLVACWNACQGIPLALLESQAARMLLAGVCEAEVAP